jgi:membrane-bound lytic murein transglycosylase A
MVHHTMSISSSMAPKASSKITHMLNLFLDLKRCLMSRRVTTAISLMALAGCISPPPPATTLPTPTSKPLPINSESILRGKARWLPVTWADLPGWELDRSAEAWPALLRSCEKPSAGWSAICAQAKNATTPAFSDEAARAWLQQHLQPYRVESNTGGAAGNAEGLLTGYFEPQLDASRTARGPYQVPLYAVPADLSARKPYWTRQQIDSLPAAQASFRDRTLAFVANPLDALTLQIQGSGRLNLSDANGSTKSIRLAFAGHNDHAYKSVGRWLIEQGELQPQQASWPAIKKWADQNPQRLNELMWANPRVVFFREEALPDPEVGPKGAQGVALTPGRSVAVDAQSIPYGTPVWLDSTEPLSNTALRKLVMAQDTGTAITGAVRADYFWGWGETAQMQAGRMKQPLRLWVLWPKN